MHVAASRDMVEEDVCPVPANSKTQVTGRHEQLHMSVVGAKEVLQDIDTNFLFRAKQNMTRLGMA